MATRPVFEIAENRPHCKTVMTEFTFYPGFAPTQKSKCVQSLHQSYCEAHPGTQVLEVSRRCDNPLGRYLSAFNLPVISWEGKRTTVESAFQSSKKFMNGGPYRDLLYAPSVVAKKDERLRTCGPLVSFEWGTKTFPLIPQTFFYDWLYITALRQNTAILPELAKYSAFTDIEFNPEKSINCQARACAVFVSLYRAGCLEEAMRSPEDFCKYVY